MDLGKLGDMIGGITGKITGALMQPAEDRVEMDSEDVARYRNMITNAERYHKKKFMEAYAKRYLGYVEGKMDGKDFCPPSEATYDANKMYKIFCNEFFTCSEVLKPNLYFQNPHVSIEALDEFITVETPAVDPTGQPIIDLDGQPVMTTKKIKPNSELLENVINTMLKADSVGWKQIAKKCTATMIPLNFAVSKWGWTTEISGESMNMQLIKDEPTAEWFNPLNFLPDPEATRTDLKDAGYVIFRFHKPTEDIKSSSLYKGVKDLKGTNTLKFEGGKTDNKFVEDYMGKMNDLDRSILYEIWDFRKKKVVAFVDGLDYPIRNDEWLWGIKGYPCKILSAGESLTGFYPTPDFAAYESLVMTKTLLMQKLTNLLIYLNKSFIADKTAIKDTDSQQALEDIDEGGIIWVDNPQGKDMKGFVQALNDFAFSESYVQFVAMIDQNIERLSFSDQQKGLMGQAKRTASEIVGLQTAGNLKIDFKKDAIVDWTVENVEILIELLQNNADSPRIQKIIKDAGEEFLPWDKDAIRGRYAVTIDMADMVQQNVEVKRKEAKERYMTGLSNPLINQVEATKDWLKTEGVKDTTKKLNDAQVAAYVAAAKVQPIASAAPSPSAPAMPQADGAAPAMPTPVSPTQAATEQVMPPTTAANIAGGATGA